MEDGRRGAAVIVVSLLLFQTVLGIFVDPGVPYANGPCEIAELSITKTTDQSPLHTLAYFPLETGDFPVIIFIGGLSSDVPSEFYTIFLQKLAAHGFYVFGIDYDFPLAVANKQRSLRDPINADLGQDLNKYFQQLEFLQRFMVGKTIGRPVWNATGLMSHSAGGDIALKLLLLNKFPFKSTAFLEPYSQLVHTSKEFNTTIPGLMYGTELSEKGITHCNVKGYDYVQFYKQWQCPKLALEVADFGHCDFLDPVAWEGCHVTHFCTTTNNTRLDEYRQFVQGVTASFFISTLQGRPDAINYIMDSSKSPLRLLVDESDWTC